MIQSIQTARAIAVLAVLFWHLEWVYNDLGLSDLGLPRLLHVGGNGVDLFFCISGFIVAHILTTRDPAQSNRDFLIRRFVRIYPFLWAFTALFVGLAFAGCATGQRADCADRFSLSFVVQSLLILPQKEHPLLGVAWSLEHEILFYGLAWLVCLLGGLGLRFFIAILVGLAAVGSAFQAYGVLFGGAWGTHLLSLFQIQFATGIAIYIYRDQFKSLPAIPLICAGCAVFVATEALSLAVANPWDEIGTAVRTGIGGLAKVIGFSIGSAFIIIGLCNAERSGGLARGKTMATLAAGLVIVGDASYTIYLVHPSLYGVFGKMAGKLGLSGHWAWGAMAATLLFTLAFSVLWFRWLERPFLKAAHDAIRLKGTRTSSSRASPV